MALNFLNILLFVAMAAVTGTLIFGLYTLVKSGDQARSRSNKLMRLRVLLQFIAIVLIAVIFFFKNQLGG
jgi:heme/copper-type cytochrome/quinol oxidase subunit 2